MKATLKFFSTFLLFIGLGHVTYAQQGFGTANPARNSVIELTSPDGNKGLLLPRVELQATDDNDPLQGPIEDGMLVYNTASAGSGPTAVTPGLYCYSNGEWVRVNVSIAASNGLEIDPTTGDVILGGALTKPTEIITDDDNTLTITGLEAGEPDNGNILMTDASGALKTVSANKFVRFFYMPAVTFDTSTEGEDRTMDLHAAYISQFTEVSIKSTDAPDDIPHLPNPIDLYYYVTYYDNTVFANLSIDGNGVLTYDVIGAGNPTSFMNIVFVIKE